MIHIGDCRSIMASMEAESVDAIVCDPPYELGFMGKAWDSTGVAFDPVTWEQALRVAKPGAFLVAFGGSRTHHRVACAIEDAGWEIRDTIMWIYGQGFPKSRNGEWGGTGLKPAHEPIVLARKPLAGTLQSNHAAYGTGGLNIDACRVPTDDKLGGGDQSPALKNGAAGWNRPWMQDVEAKAAHAERCNENVAKAEALGRWPANVIHDGSEEVLAAFPHASGQKASISVSAESPRLGHVYSGGQLKRSGEQSADSANHGDVGFKMRPGARRTDSGSAARFFYCAKASRQDRNAGLESGPVPVTSAGATMRERETADWTARNGNYHPTVKPTSLMRYLCRLIAPAGGVILDPFTGSGSTGCAAIAEGFQFLGIELDPDYAAIAEARCHTVQPGLALGDIA